MLVCWGVGNASGGDVQVVGSVGGLGFGDWLLLVEEVEAELGGVVQDEERLSFWRG